MPIYEYKCDLCNGMWEELQKFSDDPFTVCKSCEKEGGVHKLLPGQMNFILKGDGWYKDGYSSSKKIGDTGFINSILKYPILFSFLDLQFIKILLPI